MIPNYSAVAEVESTMMGEKVDMTASEKDLVHLMSILSDIYTDPTMAVAREYVTNAIDSHVEAGTTRPVEVTLPNVWQPNLIIQDFGIGMDREDILNTYSKYGASTKRESNEFNGMLGIGSKSAFAYTGAFTVVGIKNGVKTIVSVQRDAEGRPSMNILSTTPTVEHNGVTITIPVDNPTRMERAMRSVARYLPLGAVLINGQDWSERENWVSIAKDVTDADGNVVILNLWKDTTNSWKRNSRIIMGNVAYQMTEAGIDLDWVDPNSSLIAEVAIGTVVFAPSREKLMDVARTREVEKFIVDTFNNVLAKSLYEQVINAANRQTAMRQYHANKGVLRIAGYPTVQYKGEDIPETSTRVFDYRDDARLVGWSYSPWRGRGALNSQSMMSYAHFLDAGHVVINAPEDTPTNTIRRKMRQHFNDDGKKIIILPSRSKLDDKWLDALDVVEYDVIKAVKLPRRTVAGGTGGGVQTKGKHFIWENNDYTLREVAPGEKVYYFVKSEVVKHWNLNNFGLPYWRDKFEALSDVIAGLLDQNEVLVHVYGNRKAKLEDDFPDAVELTRDKAHAMLVESHKKNITDADIDAYGAIQHFQHSAESVALLPDADTDKAKALAFIDNRDGVARVENVLPLLPADHDLRKKIQQAEDDMEALYNTIIARYPLVSNYRYLRSDVSAETLKRYFESDYKKSQEDA